MSEQEFRLANGSRIVRRTGVALFRYGEKVGGAGAIFGEDGDSNLLGATTLGAMELALDPIKRELHPIQPVL